VTPEFCCDDLRERVGQKCDRHDDPYDCADVVVVWSDDGYFGLPIHDGGSSHIVIAFCPWCGSRLPAPADETDSA
jgi:hypothetical protein